MDDGAYMLSTIQAIADSQHDRIHDALDAYTTFLNRVRSQSHSLQDISDTSLPALLPLGSHKDILARVLRRDVRLAHIDPFSDGTTRHLFDAKQYARDSSSLCHHALCVLITIFRFPALYSAFSERDLSSLFGDVLDIALADHLPVLNEAKTHSLSLWALGCHRLPLSVIRSREHDVFAVLQQCLDSARQPDSTVLDGLKALSHTIEHYPSAALDLLSPLIPHLITNLNSGSSELRFHASLALGKFANALTRQTELSLAKWHSLSNHILSFLESFCDDSMPTPGNMNFASTIRAAFSPEPHSPQLDAPARTLTVLASLIILCGPMLYRNPTVLRFILQSLALALTHKRSVVRALHPHVWKCFIWTFSQMLLSPENIDPALVSSAFYLIKQEVRGGIGIALIAVLLSDQMSTTRYDERADRVSQALSVIKAMVRTECKHTRQEGFMFLQAFADDSHVRHRILHDICQIPASVLLDGAIFRAEWDSLPSIIHSVPNAPVSVHWLEEAEIARHYKTTLTIWKHFVSNAGRKSLDSGLVHVWLAILCACSHQLECDTTVVSEMLRYIATMLVGFLPPAPSADSQPDWGSWDVHDQLYSLTNVDQLWSAMRQAFLAPNLAEVAELILASILKYAFHILDLGVRALWGKICADMMTIAPPSFLQDAHSPTSQLVIRSRRELWGVVATSLSSSELRVDWHELAKFLSIPICSWVLSSPELEAWEALLRKAITISGDSAVVIDHMVSEHFQEKEVETWNSILPILALLLTCEHGHSLSDGLLSTTDVCLTAYYNQACHFPETLTHSLKLLDVIHHVIVSAPENVMRILQALRSSLCLWVNDHNEVMSDDDFNSVAVSLYCEVLKALEILPLSVQSLQITESFLASAFSRIPTPAIAPFAFEKFWRATYHGRAQFCNSLPPKIKSCLSCFVAAYGGDLADGLSLSNGSQSQSVSNSPQLYSRICPQLQDPDELGVATSISTEAREEGETGQHESPLILADQGNTTFLPPDDDPLQPSVLRQLEEYTSGMDTSSLHDPELSMSSRRILCSPVLLSDCAISRSRSPEKIYPLVSYASGQKRKFADNDNVPQKRSRTARGTLRLARKLESEPATRDVSPVDVPRMNSVPPKKKNVFDGVQMPTLREISRRRAAQSAENAINITQRRSFVPQTPSSRSARRRSRTPQSPLPPSVGSDDDLDWEDFHLDGVSESNVDRFLMSAQPGFSSPIQTFVPHDCKDVATGSISLKEASQSACSPPSFQRPKTRLDALRDVYSSVANGASQIPFPELVQATKLVHQIGAVLTEQMDKKMGNSR